MTLKETQGKNPQNPFLMFFLQINLIQMLNAFHSVSAYKCDLWSVNKPKVELECQQGFTLAIEGLLPHVTLFRT